MIRRGEYKMANFFQFMWKRKYAAPSSYASKAERIFLTRVKTLSAGDLAIDCGAHVGKYTEILAMSGANVIAFEPDPKIFELLNARVGRFRNVHAINAAVGAKDGAAILYRSPYYGDDPIAEAEKNTIVSGALTRNKNGGWRDMSHDLSVEVKVIDIIELLEDKIAKLGKIALLKMDVEGAEMEILEEMEKRDVFRNIRYTFVEMHPKRFPDDEARIAGLRARLSARYGSRKVNLDWH